MSRQRVNIRFNSIYRTPTADFIGDFTATITDGRISLCGRYYDDILFVGDGSFTLSDVTIGINFHWQQNEPQTFKGNLRLLAHNGDIVVINIIDIEDYLASVISSEMSASSPLEMLKAQAVVSRSWVLNAISPHTVSRPSQPTEHERIVWYERDAHTLFDICSDDHCQRYQGITRQTNPNVQAAIDATRSEILTYRGKVCDARFHKCCGGRTEVFETCWADEPLPYLVSVEDPYCSTINTKDKSLNNYDQGIDFYRWNRQVKKTYIRQWLHDKIGRDIGEIQEIIPIHSGPSGRHDRLRIIGTKDYLIVGKELEIRRLLSPTHLYSSAFSVENFEDSFILHGRGWGHGVGLCQVGAAAMAQQGLNYRQILHHYFPLSDLTVCQYEE